MVMEKSLHTYGGTQGDISPALARDIQGAIWLRTQELSSGLFGGLPVQSHPGRVEVSLSKTPNPQLLLMSWLVPYMAANCRWCVNVCANG